jgi:thiamine biosynthesis lipoprotein
MTLSRRRFLLLSSAATLAATLPAQGGDAMTLGGPAFGSSWRLRLPAGADAEAAKGRIEQVIANVDGLMSPYRANSELSRFNASASTDWLPLSEQTHTVVDAALRIAEASGGAFDPAVGPLVGRYGFGPIHGPAAGDFTQFALQRRAIRKHIQHMSLDLCGIAKGHALDQITTQLDALGVADYLIELGGEVFARGWHPSGRSWQVAIERPVAGPVQLQHLVALDGMAIATSGDAINAYEVAGQRYSHIIDPHAGVPVAGALASVSVRAANAMEADGLATALFAMGLEAGAAYAEERNIGALFLVRDGATLKTITIGDFADHLLA